MTGYGVNDIALIASLVVFTCAIPLVGFWVTQIQRLAVARTVSWMLVLAAVCFVEANSVSEPYGTRMLLVIVALLWSMKAVVYVEARYHGRCVLTFWQWLGFCMGWAGMRAESFKKVPDKPFPDWHEYVVRGSIRVVIGVALIGAAWLVAHGNTSDTGMMESWRRWMATALLLPGLSLVVHFGVFNMLTGFWRYFGARCSTLFRAPLLSLSLSEFWSRRWNLAFSEMTALAVFRPLRQLPGPPQKITGLATTGGFLFSGILHEIAISVPVSDGFGLPMLYFVIQAIGIAIEKRLKFLNSTLLGRTWTVAWVLLPLPTLFHHPFLEGCVWPIIGM